MGEFLSSLILFPLFFSLEAVICYSAWEFCVHYYHYWEIVIALLSFECLLHQVNIEINILYWNFDVWNTMRWVTFWVDNFSWLTHESLENKPKNCVLQLRTWLTTKWSFRCNKTTIMRRSQGCCYLTNRRNLFFPVEPINS